MSRRLIAVTTVVVLMTVAGSTYAGCCGKGLGFGRRARAGHCGGGAGYSYQESYSAGGCGGYAAGGYGYAAAPCSPCQMTQSVPATPQAPAMPTQQYLAPAPPPAAANYYYYGYSQSVTWRRGWFR